MYVKGLVPIKAVSDRLRDKNFLAFCEQPLYQVILDKLQSIGLITEIIINTDSDIIEAACVARYSKVRIIRRPHHLKSKDTSVNELIKYDLTQVEGEHFLQTHCTNPLISEKTIIKAIHQYFKGLGEYDSLLSVERIQKRAYSKEGKPINHSNLVLDQTQNLPPVYIENSNIFLFSRTSFENAHSSRVGLKLQLYTMNFIEGVDIDYQEDFNLAELIFKNKKIFDALA
jgi:CMP-N-acetylneuraminic acid synthetase